MRVKHQSSSDPKANTSPINGAENARHLMAIRIVGTALFEYQVRKTTDARIRLESLTNMAKAQGDLSDVETLVVAQVLADHSNSTQHLQGRKNV